MTVLHAALPPTASTAAASAERDAMTLELIAQLRSCREAPTASHLLDEVVRLNMPLARSLAAAYSRRGVDADDLYQVACLALLKAVYGFDLERGPRFASYAVPTIRGELRRYFRDHSSAIRPPRELQELRLAIAVARHDITQRLGREASVADLCEVLGSSEEAVRRAQVAAANHHLQSLDAPVSGGGSASASTVVSFGERLPDAADHIDRLEWRVTLQDAVDTLDERSRAILRLRFVDDLTQSQIAERIGVSQMQVSRLLARILDRLRGQLAPPEAG